MSTDFSTIDRLVEFGMGTALASQMIQTMNQTIGTMTAPGVTAVCPEMNAPYRNAVPQVQYYAAIDGRQAGPLTTDEVVTLIGKRLITADTLIWHPGMSGWRVGADIPEINKLLLLHQ